MENATKGLGALISPRSVAVIGASSDPSRIGGRPIAYYLQGGFDGALYPVNPARKEVQGVPAFPDLDAIPGPVDFALLAIPAAAIPEAIEACGRKGVRAVLIFSAGFAEIGAEGAVLQADIMTRARSHGIRVLGPNCLGLFNAHIGHCPTFTSALQDGNMPPGRVGLITQSGAYGTHLLNMARTRRIGVGIWISTGNEADVTVPACMEYLIDSGKVDAIGCYMEAVNDRDTFLRALDKARRARKPVTIM
jgi:acyl-CoA synthetase (NDP forming)